MQHATDAEAEHVAAPRRRHGLRNILIVAAVLVIAAGVILTVKLLQAPEPVDYKIVVTGNISATWRTPDAEGQIDVYSGTGVQVVNATELTVLVNSTMPAGAACRIVDPSATVVAEQGNRPAQEARGLEAWTTATCTVSKP